MNTFNRVVDRSAHPLEEVHWQVNTAGQLSKLIHRRMVYWVSIMHAQISDGSIWIVYMILTSELLLSLRWQPRSGSASTTNYFLKHFLALCCTTAFPSTVLIRIDTSFFCNFVCANWRFSLWHFKRNFVVALSNLKIKVVFCISDLCYIQ